MGSNWERQISETTLPVMPAHGLAESSAMGSSEEQALHSILESRKFLAKPLTGMLIALRTSMQARTVRTRK